MEPGFAAAQTDTSKPHPARIYNAYLGGNDNYPADRAAVRQILRNFPEVRGIALANRAFMQRAVRFLAAEAGIRQFIDIGTGIPSAGNVHEVAGRAAPDARVVYVDNDPIVHVHANALLTGSGTTGIVLAGLRDPAAILADPRVQELIDFTQPVALLLVAILHFIRDEEDPAGIVAALRDALPDGSYLALTHGTHPAAGIVARDCNTLSQRCASAGQGVQSGGDGRASELLDLVTEVTCLRRAPEDGGSEFAADLGQPGGEVGDPLLGWQGEGWFERCPRAVESARAEADDGQVSAGQRGRRPLRGRRCGRPACRRRCRPAGRRRSCG